MRASAIGRLPLGAQDQRPLHPRSVAGLMVEQSFAAVKHPAAAQVLDASCGAGIFLVLAFRRLVREHWLHDEERPRRSVIQEILYNQLRGFDVSESASVSPHWRSTSLHRGKRHPAPPKELRFPKNLRTPCSSIWRRRACRHQDGKGSGISTRKPWAKGSGDFQQVLRHRHRQPAVDASARRRAGSTEEKAAPARQRNRKARPMC